MKRLIFAALLSPIVAIAQTSWHMTCTDKSDRSSAASNVVTTAATCATAVAGLPPTRRVDGAALALTDLSHCTVYRTRSSGVVATRIEPAPILQHLEVDRAACAGTVTPPTEPPVASTAKPMPPTDTRISGTVISCTAPTKRIDGSALTVAKYRMNRYNCTTRAKLASGLVQWSTCGGGYTGWRAGECYGVVAIDSAGKESGASPLVRAP